MEKISSTWNKLPDDEEKKLQDVFKRAKSEVPYEFSVEETADTIMIRRKNERGEEIGMGFTKVGKKIPFTNGKMYFFSHVVEARMKFPNENVLDALEKLYEERPELKKENEREDV